MPKNSFTQFLGNDNWLYSEDIGMDRLPKNGTKVIVCGSRTLEDKDLVFDKLDKYLLGLRDLIVVHGNATGADRLADNWCFKRRKPMLVFHPDWRKYKKAAGHIRNVEMAQCGAKRCIAFWDGESKGTLHMIQLARRRGMKLKIIRFKPKPKKFNPFKSKKRSR